MPFRCTIPLGLGCAVGVFSSLSSAQSAVVRTTVPTATMPTVEPEAPTETPTVEPEAPTKTRTVETKAPTETRTVETKVPTETRTVETKASTETESYAGWVVLADGTNLAAVVAGLAMNGGEGLGALLIGTGFFGYFVAAPVVHGVEVGFGRSMASLGLRVGVPLVAGAVGALVMHQPETSGPDDERGEVLMDPALEGFVYGALVGLPLAMIADPVLLAERPVKSSSRLAVRPTVDLRRGTLGLAVSGSL